MEDRDPPIISSFTFKAAYDIGRGNAPGFSDIASLAPKFARLEKRVKYEASKADMIYGSRRVRISIGRQGLALSKAAAFKLAFVGRAQFLPRDWFVVAGFSGETKAARLYREEIPSASTNQPFAQLAAYVVQSRVQVEADVKSLDEQLGIHSGMSANEETMAHDRLVADEQHRVAEKIPEVLAAVASSLQATTGPDRPFGTIELTRDHKLRPFVSNLILRHFPVMPEYVAEFVDDLYDELETAAIDGTLSGSWGKLYLTTDGELALRFPSATPESLGHRRSKRAKWLART